MQEKSSTDSKKQWPSALDIIADHVWRNDDWACGIGVGLTIGALLAILLGVACYSTDHAFLTSLLR
jgi:hypothetical protein